MKLFHKHNWVEIGFKGKLQTIYEHYGVDNQLEKLEEEIRELDNALCGLKIKRIDRMESEENLIEEIADVYVVISQFINCSKIGKEIIKIAKYKVDRTLKQIEGEKN